MKIVFMGTPDFSVPTLDMLLAEGHEVSAVFTQPDRPRGRGKKLLPTPVKEKALQYGLTVYQPQSLRKGDDAAEALQVLQALQPELIVVIAYGQILPKTILDLPKHGCINLHASLLPRWRGAAPIQRAILAGDAETGITAMQMAEGLDTGDMLCTLKTEIAPDETADSLHDRLSLLAADTMRETLKLVEQGMLKPVKQDDALACTAEKITKNMSRLDFTKPAQEVDRTIRAVTGYAMMKGRRIKLHASVMTGQQAQIPPGTVIGSDGMIGIVCGDSMMIQPTVMQAEGGKAMPTADFLRGFPLKTGDRFSSAE